ncbi:hypothetical protein ZWY2020_026496 [Hordeum vulgare]|nr:hypothetical protein ZWY2020_026496 [Hordeum vulgare]
MAAVVEDLEALNAGGGREATHDGVLPGSVPVLASSPATSALVRTKCLYRYGLPKMRTTGHTTHPGIPGSWEWVVPWRPFADKPTVDTSTTCWEPTCNARPSSSAAPLAVIYAFSEPLLLLLGQSPEIARAASILVYGLVPQIFAYAINFPIQKFLQAQSIVLPRAYISTATLMLHLLLSWDCGRLQGWPRAAWRLAGAEPELVDHCRGAV